jgi:YVTN family beta-propeller protein
VVAAGTLVERSVARVGRGPVQLCSAAGGEVIVALASGDTRLTVLNGQTGAARSMIEVGPSPWNAIARGSHVYVAMHTQAPEECIDAVQVVDYDAGRLMSTIRLSTESRPKIVVPAWERQRVYSLNSGNGTVTEIDTESLNAVRSVEVGRGPQYGQRWHGTMYVANGQSNEVIALDEATFTVLYRVPVGRGPERCVVYKDHDQVFTNNLDDDTISVVDLTTRSETARIAVSRGPIRITPWDSRGRDEWAVLCRGSKDGANGNITFIDSATHQVTDVLQLPGPATNWNWGLGQRHQTVYVTLMGDPALVVVDAERLTVLENISLSTQPEAAGRGPSIYSSKSGGVFVASVDSVTFLTAG